MLPLALVLAVLVGLALGAFGGGGGTLLLPVLLYALHLGMHEAVPSSLVVIGLTSLLALIPQARAGLVNWRVGLGFGLASAVTAFTAGRLAHWVPAHLLSFGFAVLLVATALSMRSRQAAVAQPGQTGGGDVGKDRAETPSRPSPSRPIYVVLAGAAVGILTGLLGVGGGFVVVPALLAFAGLQLEVAIGTSLLVIVLNSAAAASGHLGHVALNVPLLLGLSALAVLGTLAGQTLAKRLPREQLQGTFADFIAAMAAFMLTQELGRLTMQARALRLLDTHAEPLGASRWALVSVVVALLLFTSLRLVSRLRARGGRATLTFPVACSRGH